jgi:hypothetical protein
LVDAFKKLKDVIDKADESLAEALKVIKVLEDAGEDAIKQREEYEVIYRRVKAFKDSLKKVS